MHSMRSMRFMQHLRALPSLLLAASLGLALGAGDASATPVSVPFGDSVHTWPGYQNGTSDDGRDTIGHPDLQGGVAVFENGLLTSIRIDYIGPFSLAASGRGTVIPCDLFIDVGGDGNWDYVMRLVAAPQTPVADYAALEILDVSGETEAYLWSGTDNQGHWRGFLIRDDHPYAWAGGGDLFGTGSLTAPSLLATGTQSLFFHFDVGIRTGDEVIIGFAASCANDVLYERISAPVPEPSAALLFAAGLFIATRRAALR